MEGDTPREMWPKFRNQHLLGGAAEGDLDNCIMSRAQFVFLSFKTANLSLGGVLRDVSGSSQRNQMFRVSLQVFALQHRVEWEADLASEVSLAILNHIAWMHSRTEKPHGGRASFVSRSFA